VGGRVRGVGGWRGVDDRARRRGDGRGGPTWGRPGDGRRAERRGLGRSGDGLRRRRGQVGNGDDGGDNGGRARA
jgi:hypothetical protein